jgi:hypothetical protein
MINFLTITHAFSFILIVIKIIFFSNQYNNIQ